MSPGLNKLSLGAFLFPIDLNSPLLLWLASSRTLWTKPTLFVILLLWVLFSRDSNLFSCFVQHITSGFSSGESLSSLLQWAEKITCFVQFTLFKQSYVKLLLLNSDFIFISVSFRKNLCQASYSLVWLSFQWAEKITCFVQFTFSFFNISWYFLLSSGSISKL